MKTLQFLVCLLTSVAVAGGVQADTVLLKNVDVAYWGKVDWQNTDTGKANPIGGIRFHGTTDGTSTFHVLSADIGTSYSGAYVSTGVEYTTMALASELNTYYNSEQQTQIQNLLEHTYYYASTSIDAMKEKLFWSNKTLLTALSYAIFEIGSENSGQYGLSTGNFLMKPYVDAQYDTASLYLAEQFLANINNTGDWNISLTNWTDSAVVSVQNFLSKSFGMDELVLQGHVTDVSLYMPSNGKDHVFLRAAASDQLTSTNTTPEPSTILLFSMGLLGGAWFARKRTGTGKMPG